MFEEKVSGTLAADARPGLKGRLDFRSRSSSSSGRRAWVITSASSDSSELISK
ncbi:hypothetical protein [Amycolatopsis sp. NPDC051071]|uniref:hypothetical protein n=1 Tax=Amycolatopsis sp. NPDC051071 TaxID=3154637 RepID=UPI00342EC1DE